MPAATRVDQTQFSRHGKMGRRVPERSRRFLLFGNAEPNGRRRRLILTPPGALVPGLGGTGLANRTWVLVSFGGLFQLSR